MYILLLLTKVEKYSNKSNKQYGIARRVKAKSYLFIEMSYPINAFFISDHLICNQ